MFVKCAWHGNKHDSVMSKAKGKLCCNCLSALLHLRLFLLLLRTIFLLSVSPSLSLCPNHHVQSRSRQAACSYRRAMFRPSAVTLSLQLRSSTDIVMGFASWVNIAVSLYTTVLALPDCVGLTSPTATTGQVLVSCVPKRSCKFFHSRSNPIKFFLLFFLKAGFYCCCCCSCCCSCSCCSCCYCSCCFVFVFCLFVCFFVVVFCCWGGGGCFVLFCFCAELLTSSSSSAELLDVHILGSFCHLRCFIEICLDNDQAAEKTH